MNRTPTPYGLIFLLLYSAAAIGCGSVIEAGPTLLSGPGPAPSAESTPRVAFPSKIGAVNDFANALSGDEAKKLDSDLAELRRQRKVDFAIAIVKTTNGKDIVDYSLAMAKEWKIGSENGGVLLVVAIEDRQWRMQITSNLEDAFTDADIKAIGDTMARHFRKQKYYDGLSTCVKTFTMELVRKRGFGARS